MHKHHNIRKCGGVEAKLHAFLTSILIDLRVHDPTGLPLGKDDQTVSLNAVAKTKYRPPCQVMNPPVVQTVAGYFAQTCLTKLVVINIVVLVCNLVLYIFTVLACCRLLAAGKHSHGVTELLFCLLLIFDYTWLYLTCTGCIEYLSIFIYKLTQTYV